MSCFPARIVCIQYNIIARYCTLGVCTHNIDRLFDLILLLLFYFPSLCINIIKPRRLGGTRIISR